MNSAESRPGGAIRIIYACLLGVLLIAEAGRATEERPSFDSRIAALLAASPELQRGQIGFQIVDATTGEVLAESGASQFFTPASNTKLYTTALALVRLGETYRFKTSIRTSADLKPGAAVIPDLTLVGGGDPNLSGRPIPYTPAETEMETDPLAAIKRLADGVTGRGITKVAGDIVGDDTRYPFDPYPDGWNFDDGTWYYGAPVSALTVNDSSVRLTIQRTAPGELANVTMEPATGYFVVSNHVLTVEDTVSKIRIERSPGSNELVLTGTIGSRAPAHKEDVAVADPALFAAELLKEELERRGVTVLGEARARHRDISTVVDRKGEPLPAEALSGTELASLDSAPLSEIVRVVNKVSQNLHAEILLREVARVTRGVGTLEAGLEERKAFLAEAGIPETAYAFFDGSGLARHGLTTPASTVALLRYMWNRPERAVWLNSLPVGGVDGTLRRRFKHVSGGDRVHAKTGSLSHVAALSGYLEGYGGRWMIFSVMTNAETAEGKAVQSFLDQICGIFVDQ